MPFKRLLTTLVEGPPGSSGAILIEWEGEAVAPLCQGDPFEMKVTAAHWGILLNRLKGLADRYATGQVRRGVITTDRQQVIVGALGDDYTLVMTMTREALPHVALRNFRETATLLKKEIY